MECVHQVRSQFDTDSPTGARDGVESASGRGVFAVSSTAAASDDAVAGARADGNDEATVAGHRAAAATRADMQPHTTSKHTYNPKPTMLDPQGAPRFAPALSRTSNSTTTSYPNPTSVLPEADSVSVTNTTPISNIPMLDPQGAPRFAPALSRTSNFTTTSYPNPTGVLPEAEYVYCEL